MGVDERILEIFKDKHDLDVMVLMENLQGFDHNHFEEDVVNIFLFERL